MEDNIEIAFNPVEVTYIANSISEEITPIWDYIVTLYLIGVIVMTLYFLVSLVRLALFIIKGEHIKQDGSHIILHRHNSVAPFAWCGYMMMPRRDWYEYGQMIVRHEKAHIECRHWIDLLFMQAAIIITWYCPFSFRTSICICCQFISWKSHRKREKHPFPICMQKSNAFMLHDYFANNSVVRSFP